MKRLLWLFLLFLLPAIFAQETGAPNQQKCTFAGVVQDALSGQPLPRAEVALRSATPGKPGYGTHTDSSGAFRFEAVEAGDYRVFAHESEHSAAGSVFLKPGQATSLVHFAAGQSITGVLFGLDPMAVITGHVLDADGEPIAAATVGLIREQWTLGTPSYIAMVDTTGQHGEYRFTVAGGLGPEALPAGRVFIAAGLRQNGAVPAVFSEGPGKPEMRVAARIYPDSPDIAGGTALDLRPGQQYGGIDFHLPTIAVYHVSGAVRPWGSWIGPKALSLTLRGGAAGFLEDSVPLDKNGAFEVAGVAPGSYWLQAMDMSMVGIKVPVEVTDRDVEGVTFPAIPPVEIRGHLRFDDDEPHDLSKVQLQALRIHSFHPFFREPEAETSASIPSDGAFEFHQLASAPTALRLSPPGDYYLQSVTYNQRDVPGGVLDLTGGDGGDLEVVVGFGTGTVNGTLDGEDRGAVAVLAAAAGVTGNTGVRSAAIDPGGRFQFPFVPPGRYYVWAIAHFDPDHWQNLDFVTQMQQRGVAVEVSERGTAQVEIPRVIE